MITKHNSILALLSAGLLLANVANAQMSRNAASQQTFMTNTGDNFGIGTANPLFKLDVQSAGIATMSFKSTNNNASILLDRGLANATSSLTYRSLGANVWQTGIIANDNYNIRNNGLAAPAITCLFANNNVGIGIANPTQKLHVSGNILASGNVNAVNLTASGTVSGSTVTSSGNINAVNFIGSGNIDVSGYVGFGSVEQFTDGGGFTIASNSSIVPTTDCGSNLGTTAQRWANVNVCSTVGIGLTGAAGAPLQVAGGADVEPASGGQVVIGLVTGGNLGFDNNEIMARSNGVASALFINNDGGQVHLSNSLLMADNAIGSVGIGTTVPDASFRTNIQEATKAALLLGTLNGVASYMTINRPTTSTSSEILRLRDNGSTFAVFNDIAATFQLVVSGDAQASGGTWQNSDRRIKSDITPISDAMENIMKLQPTTYYFDRNKEENKYLNLPKELQFGLIAQEVKEVFPNIVREYTNTDEDGKARPQTMHSLNYTALIPVLIKGMQEQNAQVAEVKLQNENLLEKINALEQALSQCCMTYGEKTIGGVSIDAARLEQNAPNPFSETTVVKFYIPQAFKTAMVKIYSMTGAEMKSFNISTSGLNQVEVSGNSMSSGVYQYTLLIDGKAVDSKQMILTK